MLSLANRQVLKFASSRTCKTKTQFPVKMILNTHMGIENRFWQQAPRFSRWYLCLKESESRSVVSDSLHPHGLYSPWNSPYQNTGVGSCSFLQGIFPTQGSNPGLLHCRRMLYQLSHKGIPAIVIGQKAAHDKLLPKYKSSARCIVRPNNTKTSEFGTKMQGGGSPRP